MQLFRIFYGYAGSLGTYEYWIKAWNKIDAEEKFYKAKNDPDKKHIDIRYIE